MSVYVDPEFGDQLPRASMTVEENDRTVRVTYRGDSGKKFSVRLRQKPNAIGFTARLPGTHRKPS